MMILKLKKQLNGVPVDMYKSNAALDDAGVGMDLN